MSGKAILSLLVSVAGLEGFSIVRLEDHWHTVVPSLQLVIPDLRNQNGGVVAFLKSSHNRDFRDTL